MSTKQVTTSEQQQQATQAGTQTGGFQYMFDPASMARYQAAQGQALGGLQAFAGSPFANPYFQAGLGMQRGTIGQQGQSAMQALLQNAQTSGFGATSPFLQNLMAQQGRTQSSQQAQGFNQLLQSMLPLQMQALGALQGGFSPFQTGGTQQQQYTGTQRGTTTGQQTQQMSGLGSWLPQLIGGGLGALTSGLAGGIPTSRGGGGLGLGSFPSPTTGGAGFGSLSTTNPFAGNWGAPGLGAAGDLNLGTMFTPGGG